jgi:hypothetical protein
MAAGHFHARLEEWGRVMGEVIRFPEEAGSVRRGREVEIFSEPATVIILPVVRIERFSDVSTDGLKPKAGHSTRRRRRRCRAAR